MRLPTIKGVIDRRILVNYRIDPVIVEKLLPSPFRPLLVNGEALAGICLIRLRQIRAPYMPAFLGQQSENAAHRFAVEWDQEGARRVGVYVPRRDTSSRVNSLLGGRLFPGEQHHARFEVDEHDDHYRVVVNSDDHVAHIKVEGHVAANLPETSVFRSLSEANDFFACGSIGYSATCKADRFEGLECHIPQWKASPLAIETMESSYFDNHSLFPAGTVHFDCALLMRQIQHQWNGLAPIQVSRN